MSEMVSSKSVL